MTTTKKYFYDYEDYEDGDKDVNTMAQEIVNDPELSDLEEIVIGCWGESYENPVQALLDELANNKEKLQHIESIFVGDMTFEECEVSWIEQGDYADFIAALPNLKKLTIKGSNGLSLGNLSHENLESLEIICGGLPKNVIKEIASSNLPKLNRLNLYMGVEDYGFDGDIEGVKELVKNPNLANLKYLGIGNSEIQDGIVEAVIESDIIKNLKVLDFSNGTLSDKGAQVILDNIDKLSHLELLDLHYNFLSDACIEKLKQLPIMINLEDQMENDDEYGNYPMLTE